MSLAPLPWGGVGGGCQAPSLWEGWGGLLVVCRIIYPHTPSRRIAYPPELVPNPNLILRQAKRLRRLPQGRGGIDGWGKHGLEGQNKSAQGNALGTVRNQHSPRRGKKIKSSFPFPQPFVWVLILLPFQGVIPAASFPAGRCPGLAYHCPFGALNLNW